jgi:hypothetical protein
MDMSFNDPATFHGGDIAPGTGSLRAISWHGLCARIAAAQDLRRSLGAMRQASGATDGLPASGSFHSAAAEFLATRISGTSALPGDHERVVNLNSSVNGKAGLGTAGSAMTATREPRVEARD